MLHLFAALTEEARALICAYTRQALSAAKARGVTLGNPRLHEAGKSAVDAVKAEADKYAANVLPIIREAQKAGARTLREIAEALNARGVAPARGREMVRPIGRECSGTGVREHAMFLNAYGVSPSERRLSSLLKRHSHQLLSIRDAFCGRPDDALSHLRLDRWRARRLR